MRLSYTILKKISDGDLQGAIDMMMGIEMEPTEKMIKGKELHERIEKEKMDILGVIDSDMGMPEWEEKIEIPFGKHTLVGVIDFDDDGDSLYDWKYTSRPIYELDTKQLDIYSLLMPDAIFGYLVKINDKCEATEIYGKRFTTRSRNAIRKWIEEQINKLELALSENSSGLTAKNLVNVILETSDLEEAFKGD